MKTTQQNMKLWIKLCVLLSVVSAFGQRPTITGNLDTVPADGLYLIPISHSVLSYAQSNLNDFRIWDATGQQVPYFIHPTRAYSRTTVSNFNAFNILSNTRVGDSSSVYIFKNPKATLTEAVLSIANYQGNKGYQLAGSYDTKQWYGLVNNGLLQDLNHADATSVYKVIQFPKCDYPYLKLVFDDAQSLPINLLNIGTASAEMVNLVPVDKEVLPLGSISYTEQDKSTQIQIRFTEPEVVNQITMAITSPELYSRQAKVYTLREREVNHVMETYTNVITSFEIRSDAPLVFDIPMLKTKELYIEIENKDNPKLVIPQIQLLQTPKYVVAHLNAKQAYTFSAGDPELQAPEYDLSEVAQTQTRALPVVRMRSLTTVTPEKPQTEPISLWQQPWFMWCCIGIAAAIILYYAFHLIKDLNTKAG